MIKRKLYSKIKSKFFSGRAIIILGARQVGKSTLVNNLIDEISKDNSNILIKKFNCDDPDDIDLLKNKGLEHLKGLIDKYQIIFIDEAQKLENIGNTTKLLVDYYKNNLKNNTKSSKKQIILTGSSSINLVNKTTEPLTGRKFSYHLFPLSIEEIVSNENKISINKKLEQILLYGLYPEIYTTIDFSTKLEILEELASSYLYQDILEFQQIQNPSLLRDLLKALALQIGNEVSYNELASLLGIDKNTVIKYIDLLEKNFIIHRLTAYRTNKRREISHNKKIYFWDLGIRNELINDFRDLKWRNDVGALWENFCINERIKFQTYNNIKVNNYFWRTYDGNEIDFIEEYPDRLDGYEFKYNPKKIATAPKTWLKKENTNFKKIDTSNFLDFIT